MQPIQVEAFTPGPPPPRLELPGVEFSRWRAVVGGLVEASGQQRFRERQLLSWVFERGIERFDEMTDLPRAFRSRLESVAVLHPLELAAEERSSDGTRKFLWRRQAGEPIESVWIPDGERDTFCISSQSGCPVACTFCATGFAGFSGQLTSGEIVDQVLWMRALTGRTPTNIVFMGMGEPLLNVDAVFPAIEILCHPKQVGLGARRLTVSTVGVPSRIVELAHSHPQVKLAISLHAADDALREEIIPLNAKYPLADILAAVRTHHRITGKLVTFEYVVLPGVNDRPEDAVHIAELLASIPSRINLIGFNPFPGSSYRRPTVPELNRFRAALRDYPGVVTIRRSRGEDIQGACGQLSAGFRDRALRPGATRVADGAGARTGEPADV